MNTESCLTTVLWMSLLLGYLQVQAYPIVTTQPASCSADISFELLEKDVSCEKNVTFVTPKNILETCEATALETIMNELNKTKTKPQCKDGSNRINQTLDQLNELRETCPEMGPSKLPREPSECKWESGSFEEFLKNFKIFIQQLRSSE